MPILYTHILSTEIKLLYEVTEKREWEHPNLSGTKVRLFFLPPRRLTILKRQ